MDPDANLKEQATCSDPARLRELRQALLHWLRGGGYEPNWDAYPETTDDFNSWRAAMLGY